VTTVDRCAVLAESHDVDEVGAGYCSPTACAEE
jgi:hypothetical protein